MTTDERRTAHLLFDAELASGQVTPAELDVPAVRHAVLSRRVPSLAGRWVQRWQLRRGRLTLEDEVLAPYAAARRAVLGDAADAPPRWLVRVDEVPHAEALDDPERFGTAMSERFHEVLSAAGIPYLAAVLTRLAARPYEPDPSLGGRALDEDELGLLWRLRRDGVTLAVHGHDHRTRHGSPRRRSELTGLSRKALSELLDRAEGVLREAHLHAPVFVPPFNRFSWQQWGTLATRYEVICGGPESVPLFGFHRTPSWRGGAVWLPSYPPLYGRARDVLPAVRALGERAPGLWLCITLHPGWELEDDFASLRELAQELAGRVQPWDDFLAAVHRSGAAVPARGAVS